MYMLKCFLNYIENKFTEFLKVADAFILLLIWSKNCDTTFTNLMS